MGARRRQRPYEQLVEEYALVHDARGAMGWTLGGRRYWQLHGQGRGWDHEGSWGCSMVRSLCALQAGWERMAVLLVQKGGRAAVKLSKRCAS